MVAGQEDVVVETASVVGGGAAMISIVCGCQLAGTVLKPGAVLKLGGALKVEANRSAETETSERAISSFTDEVLAATLWIFLIGLYGVMDSLPGSGNCDHPLAKQEGFGSPLLLRS